MAICYAFTPPTTQYISTARRVVAQSRLRLIALHRELRIFSAETVSDSPILPHPIPIHNDNPTLPGDGVICSVTYRVCTRSVIEHPNQHVPSPPGNLRTRQSEREDA
jgi:hypothetical protein